MSEKETLGMTEQVKETKELSAAEKAKKKKAKYTLAKVIVIFCAVLCVVLTIFEMGLTYRTMKAVEVDGTEYSVAEYNWLYTNSVYEVYNSFYQTYGDLAVYFFNPQNPLDEQDYSEEQTWADYIKEYTDNAIVEMTALYNAGQENGYEMDEEYYTTIETEWETLESTASAYGYSAGDYVELNYGLGVNEKVFRKMYERYLYAISYAQDYTEKQEISSDEIDAYYAENAEDFDTVTFKYYFVDGSVEEEGDDAELAMKQAENTATAILNGEEEVEFTEYSATHGELSELYADWLFDDARVAGDKDIFEDETGYYVIEFVENLDLHYDTVNVRHILVSPVDSTEEAKATALEKAEMYKAEWEGLGATEEAFAELAVKYSEDSSASNGGLYEDVHKGQMVEEFEDWCFDPARKVGDCEIIETTYGYHVMYYSGVAEDYYTHVIEDTIVAERYTEYLDGLVSDIEITELFGSRFVAKHLN
ncbi:MAG: peptidyl-prolyl cis-trans isomerase [Oscillospiraceae bacterium]|nr:peptidyl-prolyl cis-trans isomerase [Oscillospiraceae bacterium]